MIDTPITTPADALEAAARIADTFHAENAAERGLDPSQTTSSSKLIANLIRALSTRIAAPVAVVKPLEWRDDGTNGHETDHAFGFYEVYPSPEGDMLSRDGVDSGVFPTLETAKAAAQADYEARILSALTIQPAAQAVAEAVAGAYAAAGEKAFDKIKKYPLRTMLTNTDNATMMELSILALTPADATAALARRDAEVRKAALREAAALMNRGGMHTIKDRVTAILALIEEPQPTEYERKVAQMKEDFPNGI